MLLDYTFFKKVLKSYEKGTKVLVNIGARAQILPIYGNSSEVLRKCCVAYSIHYCVYSCVYSSVLLRKCCVIITCGNSKRRTLPWSLRRCVRVCEGDSQYPRGSTEGVRGLKFLQAISMHPAGPRRTSALPPPLPIVLNARNFTGTFGAGPNA